MSSRAAASRAALTLLALAALAAAGAGGVQAASLGATFGPTEVYGTDPEPFLVVLNRSDVPGTVKVWADEGWQLADSAFTLEPGERRLVPVSTVGAADGRAYMTLGEAGQVVEDGAVASAVLLSVRLIMVRPWDPATLIVPVFATLGAGLVLVLALRRWRPWQYRLSVGRRP